MIDFTDWPETATGFFLAAALVGPFDVNAWLTTTLPRFAWGWLSFEECLGVGSLLAGFALERKLLFKDETFPVGTVDVDRLVLAPGRLFLLG